MMTDPRTIIERDLAISRLSTDRPRRPMREITPKALAWMRSRIPAFADMRDATERRLADEAANRKKYGRTG